MADNVTMQGLEFQIRNDSTAAEEGIKKLADALGKLKSAVSTSGSNLKTTADGISAIKSALSNFDSKNNADKITRLSRALESLTRLGAMSTTFGSNISGITTAVSGLSDDTATKVTNLATALQPLANMGDCNLTSYIEQLKELPDVVDELAKRDLGEFINQMQQLATGLEPLAAEMDKIGLTFSNLPAEVQNMATAVQTYNTNVEKASTRTNLWSAALAHINLRSIISMVKNIASTFGSVINYAADWEGIANRFGRAFGDSAQENYEWIQKLNSEMGISTQEFMQYSSIFATMLEGYGVAESDASKMAMNYTELAYDIWAGYNDVYTSFEDAATAVRSAIAGEVEPIRKAGFTIVDSQLKATAANYGIAYSSQKASEELKSYLRYLTLVDQAQAQSLTGTYANELSTVEGLTRTLQQQVKSLAQAFGSFLLPAIAKVLPYVQAFVEVVTEAIAAIASFFGIEIQPVDFSTSVGDGATAAGDLADGLSDAAGSAKKLQQYTMGFDELNVFDPNQNSGSGNGSSASASTSGDYEGLFDIDKLWDDAIFDSIQTQVDDLKEKMKNVLATVEAIGLALLEWKIASGLISALEFIEKLKGKNISYSIGFTIAGLGLFLDSWDRMKKAIIDIMENGPNFDNVTELLSSFFEGIGAVLMAAGQYKASGVLLLISGILEIVRGVKSIITEGVNFENVTSVFHGIGVVITAIGLISKNANLTMAGMLLIGLVNIVKGVKSFIDAIKNGGDVWQDTEWGTLFTGVLILIGGILIKVKGFKDTLDKTNISGATSSVQTVTGNVGNFKTSTNTLFQTLKNVAQDLLVGIAILAEIAAAALIVVGAIYLLGKELQAVADAWQPVIEQRDTVTSALINGSALLLVVGAVCFGIGTLTVATGGLIPAAIAAGALVIAEIALAANTFVDEVTGMATHLVDMGEAWQPVIDDGDDIEKALKDGAVLLVAVGAACAVLGVLTIATGALLPAAIAIGSNVLSQISEEVKKFIKELASVAASLVDDLYPEVKRLNKKLPKLTEYMDKFIDYMGDFAEACVDYTKDSAISGLAATIDTIVGWFTEDPIQHLTDDISDIRTDITSLNTQLNLVNPDLETAIDLLTDYSGFMDQLSDLSDINVELSDGMYTNLKNVGKNVVAGFVDGLKEKSADLEDQLSSIHDSTLDSFDEMSTSLNDNLDKELESIKDAISSFGTTLNPVWETLWKNLRVTLVNQCSKMLESIRTALNNSADMINQFSSSVAKATGSTTTSIKVAKVNVATPMAYAEGGFVDEGQLFIAREAGAEMVGAVGRRTAVANNDQIVEGISYGVSAANDGVIAAIYELINTVEDKDMIVNVGDGEIGRAYDRYSSKRGRRVSSGVFANSY